MTTRKKIIFTVVVFVIFAAVMEVVAGIVIETYSQTGSFNNRKLLSQFHPYLGWEPSADARHRTDKPFQNKPQYISTDSLGRSITPLKYENPEVKIAFLGGSTAFGIGSDSNKFTVPSVLERLIYDRLNLKAEVFNLAVPGYQSFQELSQLRRFFLSETADIVVSFTGYNDAALALLEPNLRSSLMRNEVFENATTLVRDAEKGQPIVRNLDGFLRSKSNLADLMFRVINRVSQKLAPRFGRAVDAPPLSPDYTIVSHRVKIALENYSMIKHLSSLHGAPYVVILQPHAYTWKNFKFDLPDQSAEKHKITGKFINNFFANLLQNDASKLKFQNILNVFDELSDSVYVDRAHYSDKGAALVANRIFDILRPNLFEIKARLQK
jgi:hypothetical protein